MKDDAQRGVTVFSEQQQVSVVELEKLRAYQSSSAFLLTFISKCSTSGFSVSAQIQLGKHIRVLNKPHAEWLHKGT